MPSVNDYSDSLWRVSISDSPRHKSRKQLYYPKSHFSKREVRRSASALEHRHKLGEIDLWKMDIKITDDKVSLRQMEGEAAMRLSDLWTEWIAHKEAEVAESTITTYERIYDSLITAVGNYNLGKIPKERLTQWTNDGQLLYRRSKRSLIGQVHTYGNRKYGTDTFTPEVQSSASERKRITNKSFKDFLVEPQVIELAARLPELGDHGKHIDHERFGYYLLLSFYFPRRRKDFINMRPEWIHDTHVYIGDDRYVPKSQMEEVTVPDPEALKLLHIVKDKYGKPGKRLFPWAPITPTRKFKSAVKHCFPDLYKRVSLHKLRDSGIMHLMYDKGMSIQDIMSITGHTKFASLEKYNHRSAKAIMETKKAQHKKKYSVNTMLNQKSKFF